jgi:transglutaminase-like putative cysteine protease
MLLTITHQTKLSYSHAISESVMEVRAMPRVDQRQVLRHFELNVTPNARTTHHKDWLENTVHQFSVLGIHEQVEVTARGVVETRPVRCELARLDAPLESLIRDHRSWDFLQHHGPVVDDPALPALSQRLGLDSVTQAGEAIDIVLSRTRDIITYRKGVTTSASTVTDVLKVGAGVCQDYAHLSLALLRRIGVPCRYVSGYLFRDDAAELETHAWVEAFVPSVGWLGLDPTHGLMVSEDHVTVAVGRSYADVPPNRGVYRGKATEHIHARVSLQRIDERAQMTRYSGSVDRPRKAPMSSPPIAPVRLAFGLEQQYAHPVAAGAVIQQQRQQQQ